MISNGTSAVLPWVAEPFRIRMLDCYERLQMICIDDLDFWKPGAHRKSFLMLEHLEMQLVFHADCVGTFEFLM